MFSVENRERLNTVDRNHRIIRRNIDSVKPAQLQLDSPKHLRLKDEIQKKKQKKKTLRNDKKIAGIHGFNGTGNKMKIVTRSF